MAHYNKYGALVDYYTEDDDNLWVVDQEEYMLEVGAENLQALAESGYKLNDSQRENLICLCIDPYTFENLDEAEKEDFLQDSSEELL